MGFFPEALSDEVESTCQYMTELALEDGYFVSKSASLVALATILLAAHHAGIPMSETERFLENLQGLVNFQGSDFDAISRRLDCLC
jgi:hypothetical protein